MTLADDVLEALLLAGLDAHDSQAHTPDAQYVIVSAMPGLAAPHRLGIAAHWTAETVSVMAVGRTPAGCRATATKVRDTLTGRRIPAGTPPVREVDAGPPLESPPDAGDPRWSITIRFSRPTRRSNP